MLLAPDNNSNEERNTKEKKVCLKTYGCQMNTHDSERMLALLSEINFRQTTNESEADLILFNTCAIRDHANSKFYSHLGEMKKLKNGNRNLIIGVGGCVGELEGEQLLKKYPFLNFVFSPDTIDMIPEIVSSFTTHLPPSLPSNLYSNKVMEVMVNRGQYFSYKETKIANRGPKAFVTIMKGCNNFCSYCIVPYTRGRERSRPLPEIVLDIKNLVENHGIHEITLLGQNVNSYDGGGANSKSNANFVDLLQALEEVSSLKTIRYTTSHPRDMSDNLIKWHGISKKLANHIHLPLQSGSNRILEKMNRGYTVEHFLGLLEKLRTANSKIAISSDIICGFPNESTEDHQLSLQALELAQFDFIYSYAFSSRPGTAAEKICDQLSDDIRYQRLRELQLKQLSIQEKIRKEMVGKVYRIFVDGKKEKNGILKYYGRTNCMRIVHFSPPVSAAGVAEDFDYRWRFVDVEIISSSAISSQAQLISPI